VDGEGKKQGESAACTHAPSSVGGIVVVLGVTVAAVGGTVVAASPEAGARAPASSERRTIHSYFYTSTNTFRSIWHVQHPLSQQKRTLNKRKE
jgi:hypothetical protein